MFIIQPALKFFGFFFSLLQFSPNCWSYQFGYEQFRNTCLISFRIFILQRGCREKWFVPNLPAGLTRPNRGGPTFLCLRPFVQRFYKLHWPSGCLKVIPWLCVAMETRVQKWNSTIMFGNIAYHEGGTTRRTNTESGGKGSTRAHPWMHSCVCVCVAQHHERLKVNKVQSV